MQEAAECICNFCRHDPSHLFGRLRLAGFLVVLLVGLSLIALLTFCITRVNKLTIMHIPFAQLHVSDESEVLGEGVYGKVLKGEYRGTNIAVKRLLPPNSSRFGIWQGSACCTYTVCACCTVLLLLLKGAQCCKLAGVQVNRHAANMLQWRCSPYVKHA